MIRTLYKAVRNSDLAITCFLYHSYAVIQLSKAKKETNIYRCHTSRDKVCKAPVAIQMKMLLESLVFRVPPLEALCYRDFKECRILQWDCVTICENMTMCLHSITDRVGYHCSALFRWDHYVQCTSSSLMYSTGTTYCFWQNFL